MNKIFLIGRLTASPTIKTTTTGKKVVSFSLAVSDGKDQSGQNLTQYFNCTAWAKTADIIESYVQKGQLISIVGKLQNRTWDKPDGTKAYTTDILVNELEMLSSKGSNTSVDEPKGETNVDDIDVSNMPF